jgi:putative ABC transport system permease protein
MVLLEAGIISAMAGVAGYLVGMGITKVSLPFFTESMDVVVPIDPVLSVSVFVLSITLGLISSFYPALMAGNMDPNEALRSL